MTFLPARIALAVCCCTLALSARCAAASTQADTADVQHLMDEYHSAVVSHNGARLSKLFVPAGSAWFNVLSGPGYLAARAKSPDTPKVRASTVEKFAGFVTTSTAKLDPEHSAVHIETDGTIASVYFDFRFLVDGTVQNVGSESWQLVKYSDGWRIASIVYSSAPPAR